MNCIHCETPNPERWFYCRSCGNKASEALYTTNLFMMSEAGKRTDMEFSSISMDEHIKSVNKDKRDRQDKIWKKRIKQAGVN
tara:strand:- start:2727 stop:2972 length:246 start_codon:yes stop_codon:yes gene_type:complete